MDLLVVLIEFCSNFERCVVMHLLVVWPLFLLRGLVFFDLPPPLHTMSLGDPLYFFMGRKKKPRLYFLSALFFYSHLTRQQTPPQPAFVLMVHNTQEQDEWLLSVANSSSTTQVNHVHAHTIHVQVPREKTSYCGEGGQVMLQLGCCMILPPMPL